MPRFTLRINHKRAAWVVSTLLHAWRNKLPPYDRINEVPSRLPSNLIRGGKEEANYFFVCCYQMRGKINSETALIQLSYLYEDEPWLFEPRNFVKVKGFGAWSLQMRVREYLRSYGLGFNATETARFWVLNFQKLQRFWEGNPLVWFKKNTSWKKLCRIFLKGKSDPESSTGFLCFREKMIGMLIYFFTKANLIEPLRFPGVIDYHNNKLGVATEIVVGKEIIAGVEIPFYDLSPLMRRVFEKHAPDVETTLELADALWHLSREFCGQNPGSSSHISKKYEARGTKITPKSIKWDESDIARYNKSCGLCPVEEVCKWAIPSANNYIGGSIVPRMERPKPHVFQTTLIETERHLVTRPALPENKVPVDRPHQDQMDLTLY